jgi:molecular chaperone DnaJ
MPNVRSRYLADIYIQTKVETPVNLNKKQIEILKSFQEVSNNEENPLRSAFFKKARDFWKTKN